MIILCLMELRREERPRGSRFMIVCIQATTDSSLFISFSLPWSVRGLSVFAHSFRYVKFWERNRRVEYFLPPSPSLIESERVLVFVSSNRRRLRLTFQFFLYRLFSGMNDYQICLLCDETVLNDARICVFFVLILLSCTWQYETNILM